MVWKIEKWSSEVFPGKSEIYSKYSALSPRELAIVSAGILDIALAELLALRLTDHKGEIEGFLGLNGDGQSPAASFGARIQLGLLVGILTPEDAAILRTIKEIRNIFAHKINIDFLSPPVLKVTKKLHQLQSKRSEALIQSGVPLGSADGLQELGRQLPLLQEAGEGLLLAIFCIYQAYFHLMQTRISRLNS